MSKPKRGAPPLFELLEGNRFRRDDAVPPPGLRVVHHEPDMDDEETQPPEESVRLAAPDASAPAHAGTESAIQLQGDRLHLSLTPLTAAMGVFAIALLVMGAIYLGQSRGEKAGFLRAVSELSTTDETGELDAIETARQQPPATHLVESLLETGTKPGLAGRNSDQSIRKNQPLADSQSKAALAPEQSQGWVRDYTYIVTQEFGVGRVEDVRRAQEFLAQRGFATEMVKLDNGAIQLITIEGFNHKDPEQKKLADGILKKQRAAGTEYFATGGGYKLEGDYKTLKGDQW